MPRTECRTPGKNGSFYGEKKRNGKLLLSFGQGRMTGEVEGRMGKKKDLRRCIREALKGRKKMEEIVSQIRCRC